MYKRIAIAYNESPEAGRAFASAIQLARALGAELHAVTIMQELPSYTAFATAADPSLARTLAEDRRAFYEQMQANAREIALREGVDLVTELVEGGEVDCIIQFLQSYKADLLVIGLHRRESQISRLWSMVYEVAQDAPCSVLGVH
jgi:nucleotide-binding universal stress UspA family protein